MMMRAWIVGLVIALGACKGGGSSAQKACKKICSCYASSGGSDGESVEECTSECVRDVKGGGRSGSSKPVSEACLSCVAARSCDELESSTGNSCDAVCERSGS